MSRNRDGLTYPLGTRKRSAPSWWIVLLLPAALLGVLAFRALFFGYDPPQGWAAVPVAAVVIALLWVPLVWIGRIHSRQHVAVRDDGLLVAVPLMRVIPFEAIESARLVSYSQPIGEQGWWTLIQRKLIPVWNEPPNVDIRFRRPIRLNLYPLRWFTLLQLTVDEPDRLVADLTEAMARRRPYGL